MDILSITLWVIGIIIGHLLLRRVVEIDNMNKELVQERQKNINVGAIKEQSGDDLEKELMDYVNSQDYLLPTIVENNPVTNMVMTNPDAKPLENTNIIQEFMEEKDINSGNFGNLKAYDGNLFAELL